MNATMLDFRSRMTEIQDAITRRERVTVTSQPDTGDALLSGNAKHFKEVPLLDAVVFRA